MTDCLILERLPTGYDTIQDPEGTINVAGGGMGCGDLRHDDLVVPTCLRPHGGCPPS